MIPRCPIVFPADLGKNLPLPREGNIKVSRKPHVLSAKEQEGTGDKHVDVLSRFPKQEVSVEIISSDIAGKQQ